MGLILEQPDFAGQRHSLARSYAYCERLARREAGNFYHSFRVLPRPQRRSMCALYSFLRITDDLGDAPDDVENKRARLAEWRRHFDDVFQGAYRHPIHAAFHHTIEKHGIPRKHIDAVFDGVEMDLEPVCIQSFEELYRYCYRVASAVGLACIHIWGFDSPRALTYAERAGIAFQLTNILRDLGEDADRGRIYLPAEDLVRFGYDADSLRCRILDERFRALMRFQVARARQYYDDAAPLARHLEPAGRAVFLVMMKTYRGILDAIERRDYDVFTTRIRLSAWHKLGLVAMALPVRWGWKR